jgi:hypothetical protein
MTTDEQIKNKWWEVTHRHRRGDVISSNEMAIELVRWAEKQPHQAHLVKTWLCECGYANLEDSPVCTHCFTEKP